MSGWAGEDSASTYALEQLLDETRHALQAVRAAPDGAAEDPEADEPRVWSGESLDGRIRAEIVEGGVVRRIEIDPRAMRLGSEVLGEHLVEAMNAALAAAREGYRQAEGTAATADLNALSDRLAGLQEESVLQMNRYMQVLRDVGDSLRQRGESQ